MDSEDRHKEIMEKLREMHEHNVESHGAIATILFSIRGYDFGFGTGLSAATESCALETVNRITRLVTDLQQHPVGPENSPREARVER